MLGSNILLLDCELYILPAGIPINEHTEVPPVPEEGRGHEPLGKPRTMTLWRYGEAFRRWSVNIAQHGYGRVKRSVCTLRVSAASDYGDAMLA